MVLGPATALVVDAGRFAASGTTPEFLAVQLSDAGFARLLNGAIAGPLALGDWGALYLGSNLLLLGFGAYTLTLLNSQF